MTDQTTVRLPRTINTATKRLADLDSLATATGWERAAIVWAFTEPQQGVRTDLREDARKLTIEGFAALGVVGLRDHKQVGRYRGAWAYAVQHYGAEDVLPGQAITLPIEDFPPMRTGTDGYESAEGARKTLRKIIKKHGPEIVDEPDMIDALAGSTTGLGVTRKVMADPGNVEVIDADPAIHKSITQGQVRNIVNKRQARTTTTPPVKSSIPAHRTGTVLTFANILDEIRVNFDKVDQLLPDLDDECKDILREFLDDEITVLVKGWIDFLDALPKGEIRADDFK